jgi:hypothetical protein
MSREAVEQALAEAVEELRAQGQPCWPSEQVAPIAYRRWTTFGRRTKAKRVTHEDRVRDLVKGLQSHFEPDILYTHPSDWVTLAEALATVFDRFDRPTTGAV